MAAAATARVRLWKIELQKLADELGVPITVCHLPPGTSKWSKFEHRLFSFLTGNWRGKPFISHRVIVQLIAATTTNTGLKVRYYSNQGYSQLGTDILVRMKDGTLEVWQSKRHT
jgi:hypothetical protein